MRSSRVSNYIVNMQWNRPLWQRRTHLSLRGLEQPAGRRSNVEKWIMAKWAQFLSRHILKPVLLPPNWITSFDRRPVFQQLPAGASVSHICCFTQTFFDPLCKYLSNMWVAEVKDNLYTRQHHTRMPEQTYLHCKRYALYCSRPWKSWMTGSENSECIARHCSAAGFSWESWELTLGAWHETQIRLRIMIRLY